jgi:hypothetical protein
MARHLESVAGQGTTAAQIMDDFCGPAPKRRSSPGSARKRHIAEVKERLPKKDWKGMTPEKLVALYWVCHEQVYGMPPVELDRPRMWTGAMSAAKRMVRDHFDDDMDKAMSFMKWVWNREQEIEEWRRRKNKVGRRIKWRTLFVYDELITDWRAAMMRTP